VGVALEFVEWLDAESCSRLGRAGVTSTDQLLAAAAMAESRAALSRACAVEPETLVRWARLADLMRLPGMRDQHAVLLEAAGIGTVIDLRGRDAAAFVRELRRLNVALTIARSLPSESQVAQWIRDAQTMAPMVGS
jgi:hypothetical protein